MAKKGTSKKKKINIIPTGWYEIQKMPNSKRPCLKNIQSVKRCKICMEELPAKYDRTICQACRDGANNGGNGLL
jgi:hypothetical protein